MQVKKQLNSSYKLEDYTVCSEINGINVGNSFLFYKMLLRISKQQ